MGPGRSTIAVAAGVAAAIVAAGCGSKTDISGGVEDFNRDLAADALTLDCPKEVDGGEGTEFPCTLRGTRNGKSAPVMLKIGKEEGDLVVEEANKAEFERLRQEVAGS